MGSLFNFDDLFRGVFNIENKTDNNDSTHSVCKPSYRERELAEMERREQERREQERREQERLERERIERERQEQEQIRQKQIEQQRERESLFADKARLEEAIKKIGEAKNIIESDGFLGFCKTGIKIDDKEALEGKNKELGHSFRWKGNLKDKLATYQVNETNEKFLKYVDNEVEDVLVTKRTDYENRIFQLDYGNVLGGFGSFVNNCRSLSEKNSN